MAQILLVDDDDAFRFAMRKALIRLGHSVKEAPSGTVAIAMLSKESFDVTLLDLGLGDMNGLDVIRRSANIQTKFIVLTGHGTVDAAVQAMKLGAFSFLEKPVDAAVLEPLLKQCTTNPQGGAEPNIVGQSAAINEVRQFVARVAPSDETVAIYGETGTGKEVVARQVHLQSKRAAGPFVALNAATVPKDLFESELFGHKKGAFTGATSDRLGLFREANHGTLFIDELGELPMDSQAKLLRALEERRVRPVGESREYPVDVRIVAATNRDLWKDVESGRFREDLYFRLQVFPIRLPPLRERLEDLPALATSLLLRVTSEPLTIERNAFDAMKAYRWPGNVRELLNVLRRACLFASGATLDAELMRRMIAASVFSGPAMPTSTNENNMAPLRERTVGNALSSRSTESGASPGSGSAREPSLESGAVSAPGRQSQTSLAEIEKEHIMGTLSQLNGNVTKAAIALGIDRRTLQRKLRALGLVVEDDEG